MHTSHHAGLAVVASLAVVVLTEPTAPLALVGAGTVVGVGIDVDHFPISRVRGGDWRAAERVVRNPLLVVTEPQAIFEGARPHPLERLLTHVLVAGPLCVAAWIAWPALGLVVGVSLYVHVLADLCWDVWLLYRRENGYESIE